MRAKREGVSEEGRKRALAIWLGRVVSETDKGTRERGELVQQASVQTGYGRSRIYELIEPYAVHGMAALGRSERSDKGDTRCDPAIRTAWIRFATDPRWADRNRTEAYQGFLADWASTHGGDITGIPSLSQLRRWLGPADDALTQTPKESSRSRRRRLHVVAAYSNHVWQADQRQADFEVTERYRDRQTGEIKERRFRPLLFSFLDVYSGSVMGGGYYEGRHTAYGTQIVDAALLDAIYADPSGLPLCGVPEYIYWDNGAPHRSRWMERFAASLGITLVNSIPGEPQPHGLIEGWHRILKDRFESGLVGYVGGDNRNENRPLQLRLWDEGAAPEPEWLILDEANGLFRAWLPELHQAPYEGDHPDFDEDTPRYARWAAGAMAHPERRQVPRPDELAWQRMQVSDDTRTVTDGCVRFGNVPYTAPGLGAWNGCKLWVRFLPSAPQRIFLVESVTSTELICVAEPRDPQFFRTFESQYELKAAMAEVRETRRLGRERAEVLRAGAVAGLVDEDDAAAAERAAETPLSPLEEARLREQARQREIAERQAAEGGDVAFLPLPETGPKELITEPASEPDPLFDEALDAVAETAKAARRGGDLFD